MTNRTRGKWSQAAWVWLAILVLLAVAARPAAAQDVVVEYYHLDALGSVRAVTDQTGAVVRTHDYRPFGEGENPPAGADPSRFTGKERDRESGLDYFGARYYASRSARFTTVDPLMGTETALFDPQRWNRYTYVGNRPTRLVDPDGRGWASALFKVGKAVVKGGSVAQEFAGVYEDAKTLVASESTLGERGWAALSLASEIWSPVSIGDAKTAASFAARHGDNVVDGARLTGQMHHGISRTIHEALEQHPNLRGVYQARDARFVTQAADLASHKGYQKWHRELDVRVANWIRANPNATPEQFEGWLDQVYQEADLLERFPAGFAGGGR
jgi:RHS repeat-associated protein